MVSGIPGENGVSMRLMLSQIPVAQGRFAWLAPERHAAFGAFYHTPPFPTTPYLFLTGDCP